LFRSRLFWKIFPGYVVVILVTALFVGIQVGRHAEQAALDQIHERLHESALAAREFARDRQDVSGEELGATLRRIAAETGVRYTVVFADGTVLADSDRDPARMENHGERPEILDAHSAGVGSATRNSETLGVRMMYVAVADSGRTYRSALPLRIVEERTSAVRSSVALGVGVATAVGLVLGLFVARRFSRRLASMAEAARSIAGGNFDRRILVDRVDEVGALGHSINLMAGEVQQRIQRITADRDRLQTILAGMVEGVVAVDPYERVLLLNEVASRILGADEDAAIGEPIRNVTRVYEIADVLADALRSGVDRRREILLPGPGADRILEVHAGPFGPEEAALGAVVVLHDVTELRRLEAVRRDFVANVSHELKTPLTAIRGMLETVLDDASMPEDIRTGFLQRMDAQSDRLAHLVSDLLSLARVESRPEDLELEPLDLRHPVRETVRALEGFAADRGVTIQVAETEEPLTVLGDRPSLRLLLDNLVDNAVKYTLRGGSVKIDLSREDRWVLVEVADTGIGIDARHGDRVFERFYRVDKARSRQLGGTGLGLSIVKHVAMAHHGDVTYESSVGGGTCFRVRLPVAVPAGAALWIP
jgi:two-component system phosphate regulon sensor histidine kinase PhoR